MQLLGCNLKNDRMISVHFQGKPFNITIIQVYALTSNAEEAEIEQFNEDLQDLLELTCQKGWGLFLFRIVITIQYHSTVINLLSTSYVPDAILLKYSVELNK